jgi:hypothetical protein
MHIRKSEYKALVEAQAKLESFLAAARGEESSCGTFDSPNVPYFSRDQRAALTIYLGSWVKAPLDAGIFGIEGARDWENERYLDSLTR